ncbi:hypothetical protein N181_25140 [Sinorhizobium fredii USDA 205]|nr:hypothetical protein N181_25140 [Sinorhizobium fredii USDA 205]
MRVDPTLSVLDAALQRNDGPAAGHTWPDTRISPESAKIGRTNLAVVSCDGQVSPATSVVWAASAMTVSSIVMIQPP